MKTPLHILLLFVLVIGITPACTKLKNNQTIPVWNTLTLSFKGPQTSELDSVNPFLNYLLLVEFECEGQKQTIRGFYAADGNAAETSADSGNIWLVRFTPDKIGSWSYSARLISGDSIAIYADRDSGSTFPLQNATGTFQVTPSTIQGRDFRAHGRLIAEKGYYKFSPSDRYFLKAGANSPENFLAYYEFDGTYRTSDEQRLNEAQPTESLHRYQAHHNEWTEGDPTWQGEKGKNIIGAINYLSSKGMNAIYFLTFNIQGDGHDVWMYTSPSDFTRFDVSKLEQWERVFDHMQTKGIMLHVVTQETENELLLDQGNTGPLRQLYYHELIARFGHHLALTWNLGEENGPNPWSPLGQNDAQRKAMARFFKMNDPYQHPVLIHTPPSDAERLHIESGLLGYEYCDGLSFQQYERKDVPAAIANWKHKADSAGHPWLITMDEIGMWHTGALPDTTDPEHPTLVRYALWGSLLSGAAGVEWYFGGLHPHNDLTSEDWHQRNRLWELTHNALEFFDSYLPYWDMKPGHQLTLPDSVYCFHKGQEVYALYVPANTPGTLDLREAPGAYTIEWYDPWQGGTLQQGSTSTIPGGTVASLGTPPHSSEKDWVVLVRRK